MKVRRQLTREQKVALLNGYADSPLRVRDYAALNHVGYSTLVGWASQEGVSLRKKKILGDFKGVVDGTVAASERPEKEKGGFSFIDVTGYTKGSAAPLSSPTAFHQTPESSACPGPSLPFGLEIRIPSGITVKVDQVPAHEFWPQVIGFVRAFA